VLVLENRKELQLTTEDCKYFQTREDATNPGQKSYEITLEVLVRATLRKRPQRIIVGEIRGPEAYYALEAWTTGHEGSLCTIHSNSGIEALSRLESLAARSGQVDSSGVRSLIASAVDIVIQLQAEEGGGRQVREVIQVLHPYKYRHDDPDLQQRVEDLQEGPYWQDIRPEISSLHLYTSPSRNKPAKKVNDIVPIIGRGPEE
jgi:Flp pilus assembly CpaF family ATPase